MKVTDLIEELEHIGSSDSPENVARRLGMTTSAVARALHRAERHDLARRFDGKSDTPKPTPPPGRTVAPLAALIESAKSHDVARIRRLAERAEQATVKLQEAIEADVEDAKRRQRIADLQAELRELRGLDPSPGSYECPDCEFAAKSAPGLGAHRNKKHGYVAAVR